MPGYYDQNFLLEKAFQARGVLKVSRFPERKSSLDFQNRAMEWLGQGLDIVEIPRVCPTLDGEEVAQVKGSCGNEHFVRLLTFVEGTNWSAAPSPTAGLLRSLGGLVSHLSQVLEGFSHPAMNRDLVWDLKNFSNLREHLDHVADPRRREILERIFERFGAGVGPRFSGLPKSVIHNDVNNDNVLVDGGRIVGLIDFDAVVCSAKVCEIAIAMAYAMLGASDPFAAGCQVLDGYRELRPLEGVELEIVFDLAQARLATSVLLSALQRASNTGNSYATSNEPAAWIVLEALANEPRLAAIPSRSTPVFEADDGTDDEARPPSHLL